jgi:hypothetical protein
MNGSGLERFREELHFPSDLSACRAIGMSERTWHRYTNERPWSVVPKRYRLAMAAVAMRLQPWEPKKLSGGV